MFQHDFDHLPEKWTQQGDTITLENYCRTAFPIVGTNVPAEFYTVQKNTEALLVY